MDTMSIFGWSFPLARLFGVNVRINWTLLVVMVFDLVLFLRAGRPELIWLALVVPPLAIGVHAFAHVMMARVAGGRADDTTLWALGDLTAFDLPFRAGNHFAVGIAGPLASMVLWLVAELLVRSAAPGWSAWMWIAGPTSVGSVPGGSPMWAVAAGYVSIFNFQVMLLNLIPSILLDGGRIWRALLWPILGLRRAVRTTIFMGFVASFSITGFAIYQTSFALLLFGIFLILASLNEHRAFNTGYDVVFEAEPGYAAQRPSRPSWLTSWRARRREARERREADEQVREQEILDRLLAKVSEHGLPSLTEEERDTLQAISRRQKDRVEHRA
jgi:Zn-dependent protease